MQLILMRHAEAEGNSPQGDHGRRLTSRGRDVAARVGERLAPVGIDHAIVSTATRTRETFEALGLDCPVEYSDAVYQQDTPAILARLADVADHVDKLLVVGHSPLIPVLAASLAERAGARKESEELVHHFPTATFTVVGLEGTWRQLANPTSIGGAQLLEVSRP